MRPHPRIFGIAKWTGTILCVVLAAAWAFSLIWGVLWMHPTSSIPTSPVYLPGMPVNPGFQARCYMLGDGVLLTWGSATLWTNAGVWHVFPAEVSCSFLSKSRWSLQTPSYVRGGVAVIPLWIPLLIVGVPVAWSWRATLREHRSGVRVIRREWALRGWSEGWCRFISIPVFLVTFVLVPFVSDWLARTAFGASDFVDALCERLAMPEWLVLGGWIVVWLGVTYCIGRYAYMRLRWRRVAVEVIDRAGEPVCPACFYNLTGNVSGICPECGKPVPAPAASPECRATN
jgi:hypothetical protein